MKAVVLVAGKGSRLRPLTTNRSKHMLPIAGKPLLEHLLLAIRKSGIRKIMLIVGYRGDIIENYFGDGRTLDLNLTYTYQQHPLGTANAIGLAEEYIDEDFFLVVYGDLFIHSSIIKLIIQKHLQANLSTMAVVPVKNPMQFGIVKVKDEFVEDLIEKPKLGEGFGNLANAGIYIFSKDLFEEIPKTEPSSRAEVEVTDTILHLLKKDLPILSTSINPENWLDLGRPWDLFEANNRALKHLKLDAKGTVEQGATIKGNVGIEEGARIRSGSYIEGPVLIESGSDIGPNCYIRPFSYIGKNVRIGNACEVKASLIFNGTHIGHLSYIGDSIIGENCNIGAGTITANLRLDGNTVKVMVNSELVDSGRKKLGIFMGDNVKTGIGVNIMPGVKLESDVLIGPNVTVYRDVDKEGFILQKQDLHFKQSN